LFFLSLYLLWIVLNGRITWEIVLFGLPAAGLVCLFAGAAFHYSPRKDFRRLTLLPRYFGYLLFLWKEVLVSALRVMRRIWTPGQPDSGIVSFDPGLENASARVILADSITLTPGTITVEAEKGQFQVHCLERDRAGDLSSGSMLRRVRKMDEASS